MIGVDTNILVRFLVGDDPKQTRIANALLEKNRITIPHTVLVETEWVLRRIYHFPPARIANALLDLLSIETVSCADDTRVRVAVGAYAQGCDFADAMHAVTVETGTDALVTFDRAFAKQALGVAGLLPVRLLD